MALPTSGQISLGDVNLEMDFLGTQEISMGSAIVRGLFDVDSGEISMSNGYGKANTFPFTVSSDTQDANLATLATAAGWDGTTGVLLTIDAGVYLWSDNTNTAGLLVNIPNSTIINNGYIIGKGGGANQNGGSAMSIQSTGITITNESGAYIAGGGGGGGGSYGGGGAGQSGTLGSTARVTGNWASTTTVSGSPSGATNAFGGGPSGTPSSYSQGHGGTGGSGAYAGYWRRNAYNGSGGYYTRYYHGGAPGGRALFGGYQPTSGSYGGFWGAAGGGGGGAGGDAISSSQTYSLTNNGTIYGAT